MVFLRTVQLFSDIGKTFFFNFQAWVKLFSLAESSIEIVSYHWGLQRGSGKGQSVYDTLVEGKYEVNLIK